MGFALAKGDSAFKLSWIESVVCGFSATDKFNEPPEATGGNDMRQALLIEDSAEYQLLVRVALSESFHVVCAGSADEATAALTQNSFDIVLIDVGLPGRDGLSLCEEFRKDERLKATPILFVTGRAGPKDVVQGFAVGADDYIQKPFHPEELKARVIGRIDRNAAVAPSSSDQFWRGELKFIVGRQSVIHVFAGRERDLELTPNEFKILYQLAKKEGRVLSRSEILREVWGEALHVVERTVDKHVCSLRRKLGALAICVASVPGQGYQFRVPGGNQEWKAGVEKVSN